MITAGIDVGFENIKILVQNDGKVLAKGSTRSGGAGRSKAIEKLWNEILDKAGLSSSDVGKVVATGMGRFDVTFAHEHVVEAVADAKAARFFLPSATSVVDIGADQVRVVTMGEKESILEVVLNQKCMAGLGTLLKYMAKRLRMTLEEVSALGSDASKESVVNDGCPVFAELGALELLNFNVPKEEVMSAVIDAVVVRLNSILNDKIKPAKDSTVLIGGVSKNTAVVDRLKARSGVDFIIPEDAEYGGALGAALLAADWERLADQAKIS